MQKVPFTGRRNNTEKYESAVSQTVEKLSGDSSFGNIKGIVDEIITETKSISTFGKNIKKKLDVSNNELIHVQKEMERVKVEATCDFLTGVPNRKAFDETLAICAGEAEANKTELCLLLLDIDHFKRFNDTFGHLVGDEVLKFVAKQVQKIVKGTDMLARFGGEEFVVLLPRTPLEGARTVAESIREYFARTKLMAKSTTKSIGSITLSIGVALYRPGEPFSEFIERSDKGLYLAKESGRNMVVTESELK